MLRPVMAGYESLWPYDYGHAWHRVHPPSIHQEMEGDGERKEVRSSCM